MLIRNLLNAFLLSGVMFWIPHLVFAESPGETSNNPPVANAGKDLTGREGSTVSLNGSASFDPDGDNFSYQWSQLNGPPVELKSSTSPTPYFKVPPIEPGGTSFVFKLVVVDHHKLDPKASIPDTVIVHVSSTVDPPNCQRALPSKVKLWPADGKMHSIKIRNVVDDRDFYNISILDILSVTQDEPVQGKGYGGSGPDAVIQVADPVDSVLLRAEAGSSGNGRVYKIHFQALDGFEKCEGSVTVMVPQGNGKSYAVDDGQEYDSSKP